MRHYIDDRGFARTSPSLSISEDDRDPTPAPAAPVAPSPPPPRPARKVALLDPPDTSGVSQTSDAAPQPASQLQPRPNPPSGAVSSIRSVNELPPRRRLYRRADGYRQLPVQHQRPKVPPRRVVVNWNDLLQRSADLMVLPHLRNHVCRRIVSLANRYRGDTNPREWLDEPGVVYVVFHPKSSRFYVGETGRTARTRLREHWSHRNAESESSALSQFFQLNVRHSPSFVNECRIFVVFRASDPEHRKRAEMDVIAFLRSGRCRRYCLNRTVPRGRRLRHRKYVPELPPGGSTGPVSVAATATSGPPYSTYDHVRQLWLKSRRVGVLERELHQMKLEKLLLLRRVATSRNVRIRDIISEVIEAKYAGVSRTKDSRTVFRLPFGSKAVDNVQVHRLLRASVVNWPLADWHLKDPQIARKLNSEVGSTFRNHTAASLDISASRSAECVCHKMPDSVLWRDPTSAADAPPAQRHVLTTNFKEVLSRLDCSMPDSQLDALVEVVTFHGSKFRNSVPRAVTERQLYASAVDFATRCHAKEHPKQQLEGELQKNVKVWARAVVDKFGAALCGTDASSRLNFELGPLLEKVFDHFVIAPIDKNPQSSAIWCRQHYALTLDGAVRESFTEVRDCAPVDIIKRHAKTAQQLCHPSYATLPYLYAMPKVHKLETHRSPFRFIVGKSLKNKVEAPAPDPAWPAAVARKNSLSSVRSHLAVALNAIIDLLVRSDNRRDIKRCWIVRDTQEFIDSIAQIPNPTTFITRDFTTLYTNLDLNRVVDGVNKAIDDVVDVLGDLLNIPQLTRPDGRNLRADNIYLTPDGAWHYAHDMKRRMWSLSDIRRAVAACLDSAELLFDGRIFKQTSGIGMGHEECVGIANLYLYSIESRWVDRQVSDLGEQTVIDQFQGFRFHRRFVDDLFAPGGINALPTEEDYCGLKLVTTHSGSSVIYLGVLVTAAAGRVDFRARDKQQAFDFKIVRFPSWESCVPKSVKRGTIMGMFSRTIRLTSGIDDLINESRLMVDHFRNRGYPEDFIVDSVKAFCRRSIEFKFRAPFLRSLFGDARARAAQVQAEPSLPHPPPPPPAESRQSVSLLPEHVYDGGVNPGAGDFEWVDEPAPPSAPAVPSPASPRPRKRRTVTLRRATTRSQTEHLERAQFRLDLGELRRDVRELRSRVSPSVTPPDPTPPVSTSSKDDQERRELLTGLTEAICAAIELRSHSAQPHDAMALDMVRACIEQSTSQIASVTQSVTNGVHQALLGVVHAIRDSPQQLQLPDAICQQLNALPMVLASFEQRLAGEQQLIEVFSSRMEYFTDHIQPRLARLVTSEDVQEHALIQQLQSQSTAMMAFARECITDRNALVERLETGWSELHQCTNDFATHTLSLLSAAPQQGDGVLSNVLDALRRDRECSNAQLVDALHGQSQTFQQVLHAFAASQEGLLRQSQAAVANPENASVCRALENLGRMLAPAVEQALKAHQTRPITLSVDVGRIEELSDVSRRSSRSRSQADGNVTILLPPAASDGPASGRAPSGAPDSTTAVLKASRAESARTERPPGPSVSSSTPGALALDSCARCGRRAPNLQSVELPPAPRPGSQSASADLAPMQMLVCENCVQPSADASLARQDPSSGSQESVRDPSPSPTPPCC